MHLFTTQNVNSSVAIMSVYEQMVPCRICKELCPPARRYVLYNVQGDYTPTSLPFLKAYNMRIRRDKPKLSRHCCRNCRNNANTIVNKNKVFKQSISIRERKKSFPASPNVVTSPRSPPSKREKVSGTGSGLVSRSLNFYYNTNRVC